MDRAVRNGLVDVVMPAYNEPAAALATTVDAIRRQTVPVHRITIVDDCSPEPILPGRVMGSPVRIVRLPRNSGVSAARNAGVEGSTAEYVAFVNVDVLPNEDWVETCRAYLERHREVGVASARTSPQDVSSVLGRWRALVQERPYPEATGPVPWVAGHAMMFRAEAFAAVGGFDPRMQRAGEDVDICVRLAQVGWQVHYVHETECRSIQEDSLSTFANAEYNRFCWRSPQGNGFLRCLGTLTGRFMVRLALHLTRARWAFVPVEVGVWLHGVRIAWRRR